MIVPCLCTIFAAAMATLLVIIAVGVGCGGGGGGGDSVDEVVAPPVTVTVTGGLTGSLVVSGVAHIDFG